MDMSRMGGRATEPVPSLTGIALGERSQRGRKGVRVVPDGVSECNDGRHLAGEWLGVGGSVRATGSWALSFSRTDCGSGAGRAAGRKVELVGRDSVLYPWIWEKWVREGAEARFLAVGVRLEEFSGL
ncbi:hypothetical protein BDY21DRAFT_331909 [Lineolata rhizophorae]|uniref:Uncharacterized protein n=1 Tax=Lineolata rhizophorae TaxID=578093 RepID=A0A6A6PBM4_9PEZI|nr:hypothetical protein BDY21DRAFT_331909 [Lineolata rhizophorae]